MHKYIKDIQDNVIDKYKEQLVTELNKFQVSDSFRKKMHLQLLFKRVARGETLFSNVANI